MAGTNVLTSTKFLDGAGSNKNSRAAELLVTWVADANDGSVPTLVFAPLTTLDYQGWWITKVVTNPGSTAPTALYDITGIDADGADIFDGALENRSATATETETFYSQIGYNGFTLTLAGNAVISATGTIRLFLNR